MSGAVPPALRCYNKYAQDRCHREQDRTHQPFAGDDAYNASHN